jgi:3-hydroxy acid dehydrogenase / malonic semialdehyde reductase
MTKTALITGASSGIGAATSRLLATNGYNLILCGRNKERLEEIQTELSAKTTIETALFDVRNRQEVEQVLEPIMNSYTIDVLINNAGNAHGLGPIQEGDVEDWDAMIDGNVKGLLYVSKVVIKQMVERTAGHIINIGSIAGKEVYPNGNVYCASKHAVDALNNGMRIDLNPFGIKVSQINPGMVNTGFSTVRFKGDRERADAAYNGLEPLYAEDIAEVALFMLSRPSHVNISDVIVFPTAQASPTIAKRD